MFAKLSTLALLVSYVSAFTINPLSGATTGSTVTISWTAATTDPTTFSIELVNTIFHNAFAIANNVQTALGSITIQLPQVPPGDGYTIEAIATNNINTIYSQSGDFSIGAASSSSTTAASTTSATGSVSSASVATVTPTATSPVSTVSSGASAASSSTAASTPSSLTSSGAPSFKLVGVAPAAALVLSAVAGAAMVF